MVIEKESTVRTRRRKRPSTDQPFTYYLSFGLETTFCLGLFLFMYAIVMICVAPLLYQEAPEEANVPRGHVLKPMADKIKENIPKAVPLAGEAIKKMQNLKKNLKISEESLLGKAEDELLKLRKRREEKAEAIELKEKEAALPRKTRSVDRKGFMILGMHRSGTSMLGGLLVTGFGYNVGGPLIHENFDNEKGFFERIDAVLQNDEFLNLQNAWWGANVINYDYQKALDDKNSGKAKFKEGERALAFLNNPENAPWMQKDPRMCITLKTWLPLLNSEPAVVWTYRHPLEVALSLIRREKMFTLDHGLRLWIVYNMRGIQNSEGLCRVFSSNEAILADPLTEVTRISQELTTNCGVPPPPNKLTAEQVEKFVDTSLQHNKKAIGADMPVIRRFGSCEVHELVTDSEKDTPRYNLENDLYMTAMEIFCAMKNGAAYDPDYLWPEL